MRDIPPRHELKYVVSERDAARIRRALEPYAALDPHSQAAADAQYEVRSLYLDTPTRALYWASRAEQVGRMKVRIRGYEVPDAPVFLEIKRKHRRMVFKSRAPVPRDGWAARVGLATDAMDGRERDFWSQIARHGLEPTTLVRYHREAWVGLYDDYARVTFDRAMQFQPWEHWSLDGADAAWVSMDDATSAHAIRHAVVLELKCPTSAPLWMERLARSLDLFRLSFSKYCTSVERAFGRRNPLGLAPVVPTYS